MTKLVLGTVAVAGIISMTMVAPNALGAMGKLGLLPARRQKEIINRSRDRLIRQGLLKRVDGNLRLTSAGEQVLRRTETKDIMHAKRARWDKKWRVLIFDIPEERRALRHKIRRTLFDVGFERLQDSVWVCPYDCEDFITLLKTDFRVGRDLLYLIVEEIEGGAALKRLFNLD